MLAVYRTLLRLYPAQHRERFGGEMLTVLADEGSGASNRGVMARIRLFGREAWGLVLGAAREHLRRWVEIQDGWTLRTSRCLLRGETGRWVRFTWRTRPGRRLPSWSCSSTLLGLRVGQFSSRYGGRVGKGGCD